MADLTATTRRLDRDVDLLPCAGADGVLFERGRAGLAGRGVAMRVPVDDVGDVLAAIAVDDEVGLPGCGPVAFGALPFLRASWPTSTLVVPEVVWGRAEDGTRWVTTIGAGSVDVPPPVPARPAREVVPGAVRVAPERPAAEWCDLVAAATTAIAASGGALEKVVLAREVVVEADEPFDVPTVLARLRAAYPSCYVTHVDGFVAASPELLVARAGDVVRAQPMAGTAPRGGDPAADARLAASLLASSTYRHEHQITIDDVHDTLLAWCSYVDFEPEPSVVAVANVQHLATLVEGRLSRPAPSVLELVAALHPTPAVNGRPRDAATRWIVEHEGFDRGRYAGTVGWVDGAGNGQWAVSLRCADIDGRRARVVAGNGIVDDSDPDTELAETQAKLQALLSALLPPVIAATVFALAAAFLHAGWNLRVKASEDRFIALWGQFLAAGLVCGAAMVVTGLPEGDALPWIALSASIHLPYVLALARAYDAGDFSLAYPLARGGGALTAAIGGLLLLDDELSTLGWFAIALVTAGLASFVRPGTSWASTRWALLVALLIGGYTLADAAGARRTEGIAYVLGTFVATALAVSAWGMVTGRAPQMARTFRPSWGRYLTSGLASATAYGLVLFAVRWAPVGYVTALRESSVVLAAIAGWRLLAEGFGRTRVASSAIVLSGLVLLVIAR